MASNDQDQTPGGRPLEGTEGTGPEDTGQSTLIDQTVQAARGAVEQTVQAAGQTIDRVQQAASGAAGGAVDTAVGKARRQALSLLATRKGDAADILEVAAQALQQTGGQLRGQAKVGSAQSAEQAADQLTRLSRYLRDREMEQIVDDVERIAGGIPAAVLSGATVVSLLSAHFLKGSDDQEIP